VLPLTKPKYKDQQLNIKGSTSKKFHLQHSTQKADDKEIGTRRLSVITVNEEVK